LLTNREWTIDFMAERLQADGELSLSMIRLDERKGSTDPIHSADRWKT
jgi:hypothetical protein